MEAKTFLASSSDGKFQTCTMPQESWVLTANVITSGGERNQKDLAGEKPSQRPCHHQSPCRQSAFEFTAENRQIHCIHLCQETKEQETFLGSFLFMTL